MAHNGTRYSEEFKRQIIDQYLSGKSVAELANEYGLVEQTTYEWKKLYAPTIEVDENQTISMKEYNDLQKKMRELEMEDVDQFLKKEELEQQAEKQKREKKEPMKKVCKIDFL